MTSSPGIEPVPTGHVPMRTCVVCGRKKPKAGLLRMAVAAGCVSVDPSQRMPGRGAYACRECVPRLHFTRRVQKAFRGKARGLCTPFCQQP